MMNKQGIALTFSLLIIALLSLLVVEFVYLSKLNVSMLGNWEDERKAFHIATGAVNLGAYLLKRDEQGVDSELDDWAKSFPPLPAGDGVIEIRILDGDGKVNVNSLFDDEGNMNEELSAAAKRLLNLCGADEDVFYRLLDYLDPDSEPRDGSSEKESKNAAFDTMAELSKFPGLENCLEYLTIYSSGKININTAPRYVLLSLSDEMVEEVADAIMDYRKSSAFETLGQLEEVPGVTSGIAEDVGRTGSVESTFFTVNSSSVVGDCRKEVEAVFERAKDELRVVYWQSRST